MIFRAVMSGQMYGQLVQNVVHFKKPDATWPTDGNALCVVLRDYWLGGGQGIAARQTYDCLWNNIQVYNADAPALMPVSLTISLAGYDSNGATQIMSYVAYILRIRSVTGGKHGRGRIYVPAPRFGNFINGALSPSAITAWNLTFDQLRPAFLGTATSGFNVGIAPRATPSDFIAADTLTVASSSGVQRRRNLGVGS